MALSFGAWGAFGCGDDRVVLRPGSGLGGLGGLAGAAFGAAGAGGSAGAPGSAGSPSEVLDAGSGPSSGEVSGELPGIPGDEDSLVGGVPSSDVRGQAVLALIQRSCGQCHCR